MRKCKHNENVSRYRRMTLTREQAASGYYYEPAGVVLLRYHYGEEEPDAIRCNICGHWLSLGHSDETDERVAVEIRAAEIAATGRPPRHDGTRGRGTFIGCAGCGWNGGEGRLLDGKPSTEAGRLARIIADHDSEHEATGKPLTLDEVKDALQAGARERAAAERIMKRAPRR